jgi:hypothetical protein
MAERREEQSEAATADEEMVKQMELRRKARPERRQRTVPRTNDRRQLCSFCYQAGDHPTPAHCLRALER